MDAPPVTRTIASMGKDTAHTHPTSHHPCEGLTTPGRLSPVTAICNGEDGGVENTRIDFTRRAEPLDAPDTKAVVTGVRRLWIGEQGSPLL